MFRWFRRHRDEPRLAGRTAGEWYHWHRDFRHAESRDPAALADAVREITAGATPDAAPARLVDVLVADASDAARCVAAIALSVDRHDGAEVALIAALQDESEHVRRSAAESLFAIGSARGLAAVLAGSRHGHGIRTHAAMKLSKLPPAEAAEAVPALMVLLRYERTGWRTHMHASVALAAIGDAAMPSLMHAFRHGTTQSRSHAGDALAEIGKTPELTPEIEAARRAAGWAVDDHETA